MALAVGSALPGDAATRELATLSALPNEILQDICGYLPLPALAKLYSTSKSLRSLLSDAETWRERVVAPATRAEASFTRWLASLPPNSVQIAARGVDPYTLLKHHGGSVREAQLLFKDETSFDQVVPGHTFPFLSKLAIRVDIEEEDLCPSNIGTCFLRDIMRACPGLITLHLAVFFHEEVSDPSIGSAQPSIFGEPGELSAKPIFGKQSLLRELSVTGDPLFFAQIDEQLNCQWVCLDSA